MKSYKSLKGYLERFTLLKIGRLHIQIHNILSKDVTPFQHTHPYSYISIILSGGYVEKVRETFLTHYKGGIIFRKSTTPHRITSVLPGTKTLFITWITKDKLWRFQAFGDTSKEWEDLTPGIYSRELYGRRVFCKFDKFWYKGHKTFEEALLEKIPSIDQETKGIIVDVLEKEKK